ncbi:hypothetical protein ACIA4D_07350 [Lactobacillus delbrueckii subsp. bulgaricus]
MTITATFCNFKKEAVIISIGSIFMTKVFGYVQNLPDVMVSVQFILAIGEFFKKEKKTGKTSGEKE